MILLINHRELHIFRSFAHLYALITSYYDNVHKLFVLR